MGVSGVFVCRGGKKRLMLGRGIVILLFQSEYSTVNIQATYQFGARAGVEVTVHRVFLHATSEKALDSVDLKDLKKFDAGPELSTGTERRGVQKPTTPVDPGVGPSKGSGGDN